jgi:undecaprenyl diphosphate synthase
MDGNGRWATNQNKKRIKGHEKGAEVVREITTFVSNETDIDYLTLYAFSTENWKRPKLEVEFLMKLLEKYLKNELSVYLKNNVKFETIGDLSKFSKSLQKTIQETKNKTAHCTGLTQILAINYGSQDEILRAVNKICQEKKENISSQEFESYLDTANFGNVDLLIRTGGDQRISNYLLWQCAYAELEFTPTLWPDFNQQELESTIKKFTTIHRRFGGL